MAHNKTQPIDASVETFLAAVEPPGRREDCLVLDALFQKTTGWKPQLWGTSPAQAMIGYGRYSYTYASGHRGTFLATGFAPRKANLSVYIMPGYADYGDLLAALGKHKKGKSCLYVKTLADIDIKVLEALVQAGLADLDRRYRVEPT